MLETGKIVADHDQMQQLLVAFGVARHRGAAGIENAELKRHVLVGREPILSQVEGEAVLGGLQPSGQLWCRGRGWRVGVSRRVCHSDIVFGPTALPTQTATANTATRPTTNAANLCAAFHQLASR